ncbi:MAG: hypothetical protein N2117_08050 [Anaerolineales bacterium]|nr:hypothetical protein [Anaerolineales bacterium]MCX7755185.1 hypothetical protein [Anaerolineales bacterium]MDW8278774.1 hypothetical protein [Anaerolineales bacterium]
METTPTIAPTTFVLILAVAILIALAAGYAARLLEEKSQSGDAPAATEEAEKPILPEEHIALKVTLDKSLQWHLEVDGARVLPGEVTAEQRARLVNILVQIRPWVEGKGAAAPAASAPPSPPPPAASTPVAVSISNISPVAPPKEEEKNKMRLSLGRGFRSLMANDVKVIENTRPPSIVTLIDDFLQKRLADSPLAGQDIHLEEGAQGEVIVFVGKTRYASVNEVTDPQIQAMIRAAIKDWEKST